MSVERPNNGFRLVTETNPRVLAALARVDAMTDDQVRELVRDEPPMFVEAGEALIADRQSVGHTSARHS